MTAESEERLLQSGFRFAYSLTHHAQDAEDLVQSAWLKLQRAYGMIENRMLLFTSIRNLFYDAKRREKIVRFETDYEVEEQKGSDGESGVRGDLRTLLGFLEPGEREMLFLNCVEGFSAREIGENLGVPRNTVLGILARARRKLQEVARRETSKIKRGEKLI